MMVFGALVSLLLRLNTLSKEVPFVAEAAAYIQHVGTGEPACAVQDHVVDLRVIVAGFHDEKFDIDDSLVGTAGLVAL
jgi:hypothetical protein